MAVALVAMALADVGCGLVGPGLGLGLESCISNFYSDHKSSKLIVIVIN